MDLIHDKNRRKTQFVENYIIVDEHNSLRAVTYEIDTLGIRLIFITKCSGLIV